VEYLINIAYIVASILFIYGLKMLSKPTSARKGNMVSAVGMLLAVVVTLLNEGMVSYHWIIVGAIVGAVVGALAARLVKMTAMPEMVALFNGFGGIASLLVGWASFQARLPGFERMLLVADAGALNLPGEYVMTVIAVFLAVLIGGVTFTGSIIAWGKLSEKMDSKPILFPNQQIVNILILAAILACGVLFCLNLHPEMNFLPVWVIYLLFVAAVLLSFVLGVMSTIPIGGADMPVVISLLNSYSGLAACAAGFIIQNNVLIVAGSLVGASGIILTSIMCKAMNRSLANVLFSGFGAVEQKASTQEQGEVKPITPEDAFIILEAAGKVVFVPGYGMAVAQAQHVVRELGELLEDNGCEVSYAVHPVAGRMPGHMNVLLAEANVPYEQLVEMDDINPVISDVDVAIVIGANDVVNPGARDDESSVIYGMPIINVDEAKTTFVLKRSMRTGFAGVQNPLFFKDNTRMLFGDAKDSISHLVAEFKED
jgi:H+-translocating NAD(P) transhydrogenase subunit beta